MSDFADRLELNASANLGLFERCLSSRRFPLPSTDNHYLSFLPLWVGS